jgi:4-hydroxybenzoate polyprenyltransferase
MGVNMADYTKANLIIVLQTLVYSNTYLSLGAAIVALSTIFISGYPLIWYVLFIPFSLNFLIYNFNRLTDLKEDRINVYGRTVFTQKFGRALLYLAILFYLISLFLAYQRNIYTLLITIALIPIGIFYSFMRLKRIFILKNVLVSIAWGSIVLVVSAFFGSINLLLICLCIVFSLQFLINTIIFDIKDLKGDKAQGIQSLPSKVGIEQTKKVCFLILLLASLVWVSLMLLTIRAIILLPFLLYTAIFIFSAKYKTPWWYYGVLVDGEFFVIMFTILLWWVVVWQT